MSSTNPIPLTILTLFAPLLFKLTAPVNALVEFNKIELLPAVKLDVPATVKAPV